jgi:hypothetical protein
VFCLILLVRGDKFIGINNYDNYYDPEIKDKSLKLLKIFQINIITK